jgi:hypothetical protein
MPRESRASSGARRLLMRLRALSFVLGASILISGTVRAVDRGQFENIPDDIRAWFKGVRSPTGVPCCDISDGHRTEYDVRAGAYWVPINGLWSGAGKGDHSKRRQPAWRSRRLVCQSSWQCRDPLLRTRRCRVSGVPAQYPDGEGRLTARLRKTPADFNAFAAP